MKLCSRFVKLFVISLFFVHPLVVAAVDQSFSLLYGNKAVEEVIVKNGEFDDGLNEWIVSNPGGNNPCLVTDSNGNNYVKASNGENILQYVQLKPRMTYKFTYYVIGSSAFPAIVEFGTLNHDEGYKPLKEEKHYEEVWKQHEFTFTTPEEDNTYVIRFASSGNGTAYFDNVQATSMDLEAPVIPKNLKVAGVTSNSVSLSWEAATDNVGVTGYLLYRDGEFVQEVDGKTLSYTDTGLTADTEYTYEVKAKDQAGNISEASNQVHPRTSVEEDTQAPTAPLNLKVAGVTSNSVSLSWEAATDNVGVTGYLLYRDGEFVQEVDGKTLSYTDTGLTADTEYTYEVKAKDQAGNISEASNQVHPRTSVEEDTQAPTAPLNLKVAGVTSNSVSLSWEAATDNVGVTGYLLYRDGEFVQEVDGKTLSYTDTGLTADTEYTYEVKAKDQAGNISETSNQVHPRTSVEEENNEPLPPSELRAATVMEDKVVLMWQAADSNGISAYQVYRNDELVGEVPADSLSYTDAGLTENTNYSYTVKSKDPSGNLSKASNLIVVQTSQKPAKKTPKQPSSDDPVNHTKNNTTDKSIPAQIINKVSTDKTLLDKLPLTGSRVHPALQIAGVVIVGGIAVVWFKRRKKS